MKYFKHKTGGRHGNRLQAVYEELGYHQGYALYFMLMEICAERYDGSSHNFKISVRELMIALRIRRGKLVETLQILSRNSLVTVFPLDSNSTIVELEWPELAEIADEYTRKIRRVSAKCPVQLDKNRIEKNTIAHSAHSFDIDAVYAKYPRKQGKKRGIEKLKRSIKKPEQFSKLMQAVENYASYCKREQREQKFIKQFSTWAGEWEDWIEIETPPERTAPGPLD